MRSPLVSILIPVYNVELYLEECVQSVCAQTYSNLQIILVDDGSTDNSGKICDSFVQKDSRIQVIHKRNSGVSAARNTGLDLAKGTYIYFVDSDDWVMETMVAETVSIMEREGCDLCAWGMDIVEEGKAPIYFGRWKERLFYFSTEEEKRRFLCRWILPCRMGWSVYCRAFRRDVIERFGLRFATDCRIFEDLDFFFRYTACCQNLYYIPKSLYFYRQQDASVMHTSSLEKQAAALLHMIRRQDCVLSGQSLFQPFYIYSGTVLAVFLENFVQAEMLEQGLARATNCLEVTEDGCYLRQMAQLAAEDRTGILRVCGLRLGGQINGFCQYVLTRNPGAYRRVDRLQTAFAVLRGWKNKVLHGIGGKR